MYGFIVPMLVGVLIIVMGIINMTGNISTLHGYHRKNVTEENRKPFGKRVGLGTVIVGAGVVLYAVALKVFENNDTGVLISTGALIACIVVGMIITFAAMKKYNGGIF